MAAAAATAAAVLALAATACGHSNQFMSQLDRAAAAAIPEGCQQIGAMVQHCRYDYEARVGWVPGSLRPAVAEIGGVATCGRIEEQLRVWCAPGLVLRLSSSLGSAPTEHIDYRTGTHALLAGSSDAVRAGTLQKQTSASASSATIPRWKCQST
jgi:hypothetical protein